MLSTFVWVTAAFLALATEGTSEAAKKPQVTRADLALALQRFERAFLAHRPEGKALVEANLAFEDVTQSFFRMNFSGAIAKLNETALAMQLGRAPTAEERWLASLKVTVDPPVVVEGGVNPKVRVTSMYPVAGAKTEGLGLVVRQGEKVERFVVKVVGDVSKAALAEIELKPAEGGWKGTWEIGLKLPMGMALDTGRRLTAVQKDLDRVRASNADRLEKIKPREETKSAWATCKARNDLLKMNPSEARSVEFLADYNTLAPEIEKEIKTLESGRNPYARRKGDYWRVLEVGSTRIPLRIYAPESAAAEKAAPLVVVLHGAGGDENMFLDAYGEGAIKREADKRGFLVASPATFFFTTSGKHLKPLVEDLSRDYSIDANRVYVLGHSMGAMAAAVQARENSDVVAAACCIAGGRGFGEAKTISPTLVVAAELDALVPLAALEAGVRPGIAEGLPIEFRKVSNYGHTLVVEAELGRCLEWLLGHRRGG